MTRRTPDDTSSTFLLCEIFHFNYLKHAGDIFNGIFVATSLDHRSETWMAIVMSRFPYNIKRLQIECRRNANNKQNQQSAIQLPFFSGFDFEFVDLNITKNVCTTSLFRNFLMSKSKRDFMSERRNRRSNAVSII